MSDRKVRNISGLQQPLLLRVLNEQGTSDIIVMLLSGEVFWCPENRETKSMFVYEKRGFLEFINQGADLAVLTIPYQVNVPYAVLETKEGKVKSFKEKPTYTYYSNGGIYLMKKDMLKFIPKDTFFNATDLMEELIKNDLKVISFPFSGYWLDVGKHEDFEKAHIDIHNIKF